MPNKSFYFSDGPYLEVMEGLFKALAAPEAFVKFIGLARTGKSALCEKLTQFMEHRGYRVVNFPYAVDSPEALKEFLAQKLGRPNSVNFSRMLQDIPEAAEGKPLILIFDDAHQLSTLTLVEIYRLAEVQLAGKRMLNIVLCGEPALEQQLLSKRELKSLLLQISHSFVLPTMNAEEASHFLISYLQQAKMPGLQLQPGALNYYFKSSKGYPGVALSLCKLMVAARSEDQELQIINKEELEDLVAQSKETMAGQGLPQRASRQDNQWLLFGPVAVVLIIFSLGMLYKLLRDAGTAVETESPAQTTSEQAITNQASPFADDTLETSDTLTAPPL